MHLWLSSLRWQAQCYGVQLLLPWFNCVQCSASASSPEHAFSTPCSAHSSISPQIYTMMFIFDKPLWHPMYMVYVYIHCYSLLASHLLLLGKLPSTDHTTPALGLLGLSTQVEADHSSKKKPFLVPEHALPEYETAV